MIFKTIKEKAWQRYVKKMQRELDKVHAVRDYYNKLNKTCYTTKQALELAYKNEIQYLCFISLTSRIWCVDSYPTYQSYIYFEIKSK